MANENKRIKMAVIAGASKALNIKAKERMISDEEVIQKVNRQMDTIVSNIDKEH